MKRRTFIAAVLSLLSCVPSIPDVVTKEMIWVDPPSPPPGIGMRHEPHTIDLAFAEAPSNHILLRSARLEAMLRAKGQRKVKAVFHVTWKRFGTKVHSYNIVSLNGEWVDATVDDLLGSFSTEYPGEPLPF